MCISTLVSWLAHWSRWKYFPVSWCHLESVLSGQLLYWKTQNECHVFMSCFFWNTCSPVSYPVGHSAAFTVVGPSLPASGDVCLQAAQEHTQRLHSGDRLCVQDWNWMLLCVAVLRLWAFSLCLRFLQHLSVTAALESSAWLPEMLMHLSVSSFNCFYWLVLNPISWWERIWTR